MVALVVVVVPPAVEVVVAPEPPVVLQQISLSLVPDGHSPCINVYYDVSPTNSWAYIIGVDHDGSRHNREVLEFAY